MAKSGRKVRLERKVRRKLKKIEQEKFLESLKRDYSGKTLYVNYKSIEVNGQIIWSKYM